MCGGRVEECSHASRASKRRGTPIASTLYRFNLRWPQAFHFSSSKMQAKLDSCIQLWVLSRTTPRSDLFARNLIGTVCIVDTLKAVRFIPSLL